MPPTPAQVPAVDPGTPWTDLRVLLPAGVPQVRPLAERLQVVELLVRPLGAAERQARQPAAEPAGQPEVPPVPETEPLLAVEMAVPQAQHPGIAWLVAAVLPAPASRQAVRLQAQADALELPLAVWVMRLAQQPVVAEEPDGQPEAPQEERAAVSGQRAGQVAAAVQRVHAPQEALAEQLDAAEPVRQQERRDEQPAEPHPAHARPAGRGVRHPLRHAGHLRRPADVADGLHRHPNHHPADRGAARHRVEPPVPLALMASESERHMASAPVP
jgi:hypothetical protein